MPSTILRLSIFALIAALPGCANTPSNADHAFGSAAKRTLRLQILNPGPPSPASISGMDGKTAKSAYDAYQKSFREPVPQTGALAVGVGR